MRRRAFQHHQTRLLEEDDEDDEGDEGLDDEGLARMQLSSRLFILDEGDLVSRAAVGRSRPISSLVADQVPLLPSMPRCQLRDGACWSTEDP